MSFWDNLQDTLVNAGNKTKEKTKELANSAKVNSMIYEEKKKIQKAYTEIGRIYYEKFGDSADEAFAEQIQAIRDASQKIENYQHIDVKKTEKCPNCGEAIEGGLSFCPYCGYDLRRPSASGHPASEEPEAQTEQQYNAGTHDEPTEQPYDAGTHDGQAEQQYVNSASRTKGASAAPGDQKRPVRTCPNCGSPVADDADFCMMCGAKLEKPGENSEAVPAEENETPTDENKKSAVESESPADENDTSEESAEKLADNAKN